MSAPYNEPAFPVQDAASWQSHGMTLRDYFAAKALAALIGHEGKDYTTRGKSAVPTLARFAYEYADAMLDERTTQHPGGGK